MYADPVKLPIYFSVRQGSYGLYSFMVDFHHFYDGHSLRRVPLLHVDI